jgi:PAS domain S-box-containing protein
MTPPMPLRILSVDDYAPARYARAKLLRQAGFDVLEAASGEDALAQAAAARPDVVLLDINLPDLDGYEVCRRLKTLPATAGIPVLHLSASQRDAVDHARGLDAGADGFLVEPVAPEVLLATVRSVARARLAEDAVRTAARQWALTFEAITDGVCLVDREGSILRHNGVFAGLAGAPALNGRPLLPVLERMLERPAAELSPLLAAERRAVREFAVAGRWLHLVTEPVTDEAGGREGAVLIITDISVRKRVESMRAELLRMEHHARLGAEAANRAKDEFLAVLSHELRTPLTAMLGWIRMLAAGRLDHAGTLHAIEVLERNTRLQAQIVEDLLDVSRIVSGKMTLTMGVVPVDAVLRAAVEGQRAAAAAKDVSIEVDVPAGLPPIHGDAVRLEQVFGNLLSNAVKFTLAGGRVAVAVVAEPEALRVDVTDTGRGIEASLLPHVFEPFRQAEGSSRRTHTGLGLGLAIVRHLVELHGGRVAAASDGLGQGSTFTVWFPAAVPQHGARVDARAGAAEGERLTLAGVRLLLVEDDVDTREIVTLMLRESGAEVAAVDSAGAAIEMVRTTLPDVLVSDIGLGDRDGYDLIREVRRLPGESGRTPAIALSAFARESDRLEALRAGYDRHVAKPAELRSLLAAVTEVLDARSAQR